MAPRVKEKEIQKCRWQDSKLKKANDVKWRILKHRGPLFAQPYKPLPKSVKFHYKGKTLRLSKEAEEAACFFAKMQKEKISLKTVFKENFLKSWREVMKSNERQMITNLKFCNFKEISQYFEKQKELKKRLPADKKRLSIAVNDKTAMKFGYCNVDGNIQKIGNFKIEPPGLFCGRGNHPKMGLLKRRVNPSDVTINIGKRVPIPKPSCGGSWKNVIHDQNVTWLASWKDNITNKTKYMRLDATSKITGKSDFHKYELARMLEHNIQQIRDTYLSDMTSENEAMRQRAVALYFIDMLALRVGNEKKKEDTADTVGCCSLRVEHIKLFSSGQEKCVELNFKAKDSIDYKHTAVVPTLVWHNLKLFVKGKKHREKLFNHINASDLNAYLDHLMPGLTAKVFRTYHASWLFEFNLNNHTQKENMSLEEKLHNYRCANRDVAILCNHMREVPMSFQASLKNLHHEIAEKKHQIAKLSSEVHHSRIGSSIYDRKIAALTKAKEQLKKLLLQELEKAESKNLNLGTSKLNYIDPRITVAWCKRWKVPIKKIYSNSQIQKFQWAIEKTSQSFRF